MMNAALTLAVLTLISASQYHALAGSSDGFLHNGVTAHRGNSADYPANTLPAFRSAIEVGADWIELDVLRTRDGQLVIGHDRTTGAVGDKDLVVPDSAYEELLTVDVAAAFRRAHQKTIAECPRHTMPLLEEVLRLMMTQNRTRVSIQPKMDCVADIAALIKRLGAGKWVGFNDTSLAFMSQAKKLVPEATIFWDRSAVDIEKDTQTARAHGFHAMVLRSDLVTDERVRAIHRAGLKAGAWTINDPAAMKSLLALGIDRIYTDYPSRLLAIQRERAH